MTERLPHPTSHGTPSGNATSPPGEKLKYLLDQCPFVALESKGLFIGLDKLSSGQAFKEFVDRVFQGGHYFAGLSHKNLVALVYRFGSVKAQFPRLRLADGFAPLLPRREALYQGELAADSLQAEYDFSFQADSRATFAQGMAPHPADEAPRMADEFVAVLWKKGIRFGLDMEAIRQGLAIPANKYLKLVIARAQTPQPGADARIEHLISLEKDLRPLETPEGEVDLRRYLCVFPQAKAQQVILRKIPPTAGQEGHDVAGEPIPTELAGRDLALEDLLGTGVALAQVGKHQSLVATRSGFVSVNPQGGVVSVTDEVINHTPVGIKTGSLTLEAELCVQFGGVSHGYSLAGRDLEIRSGRVEGSVLSRQGDIKIGEDVIGGQATALAGDILVKGKVMAGSRLEAYAGSITLAQAENSLLIGKLVVADRVVNCNVIAERVMIKEAVGAGVFCFGAKIERIVARRPAAGDACLESGGTTLVVPIIEPPRRPAVIIERTMEVLLKPLPELEAHIEQIGLNEAVRTYLRALLTYQTTKNEEQARKALSMIQSLEEKVLPVVERWRAMKEERQRLVGVKSKLEAELEVWRARIRRLEENLQGAMQFSVGSVSDANSFLKLYYDPRLPEGFSQIAAMEAPRRGQFENLCMQIISAPSSAHVKERLTPLGASLKSTYQQLRTMLEEAEDKPSKPAGSAKPDEEDGNRREKRLRLLTPDDFLAYLGNPERKAPEGRFLLPVKVDQILEGFVSDFTGMGMALILDRQQRYLPIFFKGDKVGLEFSHGSIAMRLEMVVVGAEESGRLVRVGGFFVNLPPALQTNLYKIKNALETRILGGAD